ncbi:zinc-binding dehydrogenase [Thermohalobacter berrensis]|uniref:L-sorbose 1-phosphate reductase n=1 Tax=Thermohalobacter berrensis TaxID=99594 RepID=A0A419SXP3_9FIRM|nr:zinc-binding dehydrogenase [Thermohalobacter berrensis]RKD30032.1 L-sorbose 1-phosphate reductase [Thermohalobacter berrensis]
MKTRAVRLYAKNDLRLEEFELPEIKEDEILAKVVSNSICMSTYKAVIQGTKHKRVPEDIAENPIITGHEFAGEIVKVGAKWKDQFKEGSKFALQPALNYKGKPYSPGYSYKYFGGNATYIIIPNEVMELGCLLNYDGDAFYEASLAEPMSCIIGAFHANYHTKAGVYEHFMDVKEGGNMALLGAAGPMGLGAIDYAIHRDRKPKMLVVTDIDEERLERARSILTEEDARKNGVELKYVNTKDIDNVSEYLRSLTGGEGYDDVFVYAPVEPLIEDADKILAKDGCLNFFAGPTDKNFSAELNFYNVHYASTHIVGTSGGNTDDLKESLEMTSKGLINPAVMITHVGGLNSVKDTTLNLPNIPGGKKLIYTHVDMELTAIEDFEEKGKTDDFFAELAQIVKKNNGLWSLEAERFLLENKSIK